MPELAQPVTDMATPDQLRVRWGLLAATYASIGVPDVFSLTGEGAFLDDHGGNWAAFSFAGGRRSVFFGYDHEYSQTTDADPPIDLLDGGPPWLPWARLGELAGQGELGWCYWHDGENWQRNAAAAVSGVPDGREAAAAAVLSDERASQELAAAVTTWAPRGAQVGGAQAGGAAAALLDAAYRCAVDADALRNLLRLGRAADSGGLSRGLALAAAAGLTPGSRSPLEREAPPAGPRPRRRRRRLSEEGHQALVWSALRSAQEAQRSVPAAHAQARQLAAWLHGHGRLRPAVNFQICAGSSTAQELDGISYDDWREVATLAKRLREAEAHPEQGRWIWLRVALTAGGVRLERAYDHLPVWWAGTPEGLWLRDLASEMEQRAPAWRPRWTDLLDPGVAWEEI